MIRFTAITRSDAERLTDRLIEITAPQHPIDRDLIAREIDRILTLYVDVSLENLRFSDESVDIMTPLFSLQNKGDPQPLYAHAVLLAR